VLVLKRHATELFELHIHWHIMPRLAADPAPREAVWGIRFEPKPLPPDERHERIARTWLR